MRPTLPRRPALLIGLGLVPLLALAQAPSPALPAPSAAATQQLKTLLGAPGHAALKPNERLQGVIEIDIGQGPKRLLSVATLVDKDLGQQAAAQLKTAQGQQAVADAQAQAGRIAGQDAARRVNAAEVQATADFFAGKTLYSSQATRLDIIKEHQISLNASAPDGSSVSVGFGIRQSDLALQSASVAYRPAGARLTDTFDSPSSGAGAAQVTIDRIERLGDRGFSVWGRFKAGPLTPGVLAKRLAGQTLPSISGRFAFTTVPMR